MSLKKLSRKQRNLGKHDAPLKWQFEQGHSAFKRGQIVNPFSNDTMQWREWERGFNKAYYEQLKRIKKYELGRRGKEISGETECRV
jgi:hypothetical protein